MIFRVLGFFPRLDLSERHRARRPIVSGRRKASSRLTWGRLPARAGRQAPASRFREPPHIVCARCWRRRPPTIHRCERRERLTALRRLHIHGGRAAQPPARGRPPPPRRRRAPPHGPPPGWVYFFFLPAPGLTACGGASGICPLHLP